MTAAEAERILREALASLLDERVTRSPLAPTADVGDALAALDFLLFELERKDKELLRLIQAEVFAARDLARASPLERA